MIITKNRFRIKFSSCEICFFIITIIIIQMKINYRTQGTCSSFIEIEVEDNKVKEVSFTGGCNGNLKGICSLVKGMDVNEVISRLEGIHCGNKNTSCPDQLCKALKTL